MSTRARSSITVPLCTALTLAGCVPDAGFGLSGAGAGAGGGKADEGEAATTVDVVFSPQPYAESHLTRVREWIDAAQESLDIAMYSFSDARIVDALERALARGVSIRLIFEDARAEYSELEGTQTARLEDMGIEVRWINRVMHHKFVIVDGYCVPEDAPGQGVLLTGSANWSNSAGTIYDENTLVIQQSPELLLRYQQEFNRLWEGSRTVVRNEAIPHLESAEVSDEMIPDDPRVEALFTSANFEVRESAANGPTWSVVRGQNTVADRWVALIRSAQSSIWIASGHLRSRAVAEALMAKLAENPSIDIRVYLDAQEFISESTHERQLAELEQCLRLAGDSEARRQDCVDRGFLFGYQIGQAGIAVKYKYYAYRWDYHYAAQMHHKYMLIDATTLLTGSYNLSDNAEHNTMENVVVIDGNSFPELVAAYRANFEQIWVTGEMEGLLESLTATISDVSQPSFPIVFPSMALTWQEVTDLKRLIWANCPAIDSTEFKSNPNGHRSCTS